MRKSNWRNYFVAGGFFLAAALSLSFFVPVTAFADIQSSVTNAGNNVYNLIKAVSGAVGAGIMAIGWFGNMIPFVEISQKAKMVIFKVGISIVGISFTMQLVQWFQSMN